MTHRVRGSTMHKELFGVFDDASEFRRFRSPESFDRVVEGESVTVGIRDVGLQIPNRSSTVERRDGVAVVWGEVYLPAAAAPGAAEWLLERYRAVGTDAFGELNGSFLAVVDDGDDPVVATDVVRSWECFYTDDPGVRVFGTDPAAVARTIETPNIRPDPLLEGVHLGVVTGDRTIIDQLERIPFDGVLGPTETRLLDRFVYDPREFDYADELARRLRRALQRRSANPGRKGVLLSGGYDSRTIVASLDGIDECYTVGTPDAGEVSVARRVSTQYGVPHRTLVADDRYLSTERDVIQYGQGLCESIHVHHAGYLDEMAVDTMYHGLLFDTILRGYFLPRDGVEVLGHTLPLQGLDPEPDVTDAVAHSFGFLPASESIFPDCEHVQASTSREFIRTVIESGLEEWSDRYDSLHNGIDLFGIQNQPTIPFRTHLADHYLESFVAVDAELVDWHLKTPPEHRNTKTFLRAIRKLDPEILRHRPPDRPTDSTRLNEISGFLRRSLPGLAPFDGPWPDRERLYDQANLDQRLFEVYPDIHGLPARLKLRINDITTWLELATGTDVTPADVLCPPFGAARQRASRAAD